MLDDLISSSDTPEPAEAGTALIEIVLMAGAVLTAALVFLPPVAH